MNNIFPFPPTTTNTVEQALKSSLDMDDGRHLKCVLVCGYDNEDKLFVRSSRMTRQEALWLSQQMVIYALNPDY